MRAENVHASPPVGLPQPSRFGKGVTGRAEDVGRLSRFGGSPVYRPTIGREAFSMLAGSRDSHNCYAITFLQDFPRGCRQNQVVSRRASIRASASRAQAALTSSNNVLDAPSPLSGVGTVDEPGIQGWDLPIEDVTASSAASRSCTLVALMLTAKGRPKVSMTRLLLRPFTFLPAS